MLDGAHDPMSLAEGADVEFLEVFKLKVKQHTTGDVVEEELVDDTGIKASLRHPVSNLKRRPASNLRLVEFGNCSVKCCHGSARVPLLYFHRYIFELVCEAVWGAREEMWSLGSLDWLAVEVKLEAAKTSGLWGGCLDCRCGARASIVK